MMTDPTQYTPPPDDQAVPTNIPPKVKARVPSDSELAARWIMRNHQTAWGLNEFRRYKNGIWPPVEKDIIKREVKAVLDKAQFEGVRTTNALVNSVTELARMEIAIETTKWDSHTEYLPCQNGVLHIPSKSLLPHTPDIYATSQLSFDYDPTAIAHAFMYALQRIPDETELLQEFAGYALTPEVKYEIAIWMQGIPGSGRSTIIEGLQAMLGSRCGTLGLAEIERSRFGLSQLPGKTLVVSTEQPDSYMSMTHILNALISGEPIRIEEKYKEAMTIIPRVKIIWAMNNIPRVNDANNGLMRRVKVIKFPILPEDQKDVDLKERIKTEGAGILNWALEGLERLNKRGKFLIPQSVQDATKEFQEKNDIPKMFLEEIGAKIDLLDPQCRTAAQYLYDQYSDWCKRNNHKPMASTKMAEEWRRLGFERTTINGHRYWIGVEISSYGSASNVP